MECGTEEQLRSESRYLIKVKTPLKRAWFPLVLEDKGKRVVWRAVSKVVAAKPKQCEFSTISRMANNLKRLKLFMRIGRRTAQALCKYF